MKNMMIVLFTFLISIISSGQEPTCTKSENCTTVEKTIQNYINGSSYNKLALLESAFANNATLYLTGKDGFKIYSPKEYVGFFKGKETGVFNGRVGEIISVDVYEDIATAKATITIAKSKSKYIDLFLLKKTETGWKIISKTATKIKF